MEVTFTKLNNKFLFSLYFLFMSTVQAVVLSHFVIFPHNKWSVEV